MGQVEPYQNSLMHYTTYLQENIIKGLEVTAYGKLQKLNILPRKEC